MTDIILSIFLPILFTSFVVFIIMEARDNKKRTEKYIEECNVRIDFFKNNTRLTDELENLWTAVAFDEYPIYMNEEVGRKATEFNEEERRKAAEFNEQE